MVDQLRIVRVVPDVSGIDGEFDYLVPAHLDSEVRVGTIVRIVLQNRRVRAWVIATDVTPPEGVRLLEIQKVTGWGPPQELIDLAGWAAKRWIGKRSFHLQTASPLKAVRSLPPPVVSKATAAETKVDEGVLRLPPASSPLETVLAHDNAGPMLLITPTQRSAETWVKRLRQENRNVALYPQDWAKAAAGGVTVVGTRAAAWAPMPQLSSVVVLDAHDDALVSESTPTWSAVDVVSERARKRQVPCLLVSSVPRVAQLHERKLNLVSRDDERRGWAPIHTVDLRKTDPRKGIYSPALVELLRSEKRVICVLNRKGRATLLVCSACDEIARCENCGGSCSLTDEQLVCKNCSQTRPVVCMHCKATKLKQLRPGVNRVREELESLALRSVGEVTGESDELPLDHVIVGTEAVLFRVSKADAIVFLDFDQELLAPRMSASEDALVLLARASRIVGGRTRGGIVTIQTRQPEHEAIEAALHADPQRLVSVEMTRREQLGWPPFRSIATTAGPNSEDFVSRLDGSVDVLGPIDGRWMISANSIDELDLALWAAKPTKGTRIAVNPARL